ncbi:MAG: hypothetical protein ACJAUV_000493 [Flavobacteriales bacterium]|jgi:hypothetical protein
MTKTTTMKTILLSSILALYTFSGIAQTSPKIKVANTSISFPVSDSAAIGIVKKDSTKIEIEGHIEVGVNGYLSASNSLTLDKDQELMELNYGRSRYFAWYLMADNIHIIKNRVYLLTGLGLSYNGYFFENNINIGTDNDTTLFSRDTVTTYDKFKLRATYLQIPIMFRIRFHQPKKKGVDLAFGVLAGYRIGSRIKTKYSKDGDNKKDKIIDDFNFSPFKADLTARIGYKDIGLVFNYSLTPLFEKNKAPELYPFSVGITIGGGF